MKTDNGALSYEADIDNDKLIQSVDEMEKRIQGFSKTTVKEGQKIDNVFDITAENIKIQKDVIAQLEKNVNNLNIEISKLKPGAAQDKLKQEAKEVAAELKAEKDALKMLESQVKVTEERHVSFRTQLRNAREELIRMEQAGQRGTAAYTALQKKVGELQDAYDDATQQARVLANDERGFQGVVSMVGGLTGAMSAAQGAVGLFAGENENLNKIMLRVQSLMGITIGLQQVAQMLNKDSYFSIVVLGKAKEMLAIAEMKVATALGISTVAAQVLMATLTLGLSVAITAIIVALSKLTSKQAEAKKQQEEFNKAVAESAAEPVTAIMQLSSEWTALGNNLKAKEKYIADNAEKFNDLGAAVTTVNEAEDLLVKNKDKFIEAMVMRAKAMAAVEIASGKYKEALLKELELENTPKTKTRTVVGYGGGAGSTTTYEVENKKYAKVEGEKKKLEAEAADLMAMSVKFTEQEKATLKSIGVASTTVVEGSIQALKDSIARLEERYEQAATGKGREALLKEINKQKELLDKMDKSDESNKKATTEDPLKKELDRKKNLYTQYYKWVNSNDPVLQQAAKAEFAGLLKQGSSYLDYLQKQRDQIMNQGATTADLKAKLQAVNNAIAEESRRTVLNDFESSLNAQIEKAGSALEIMKVIKAEKDKLAGDNSDLDNAKKDFLEEAERQAQEKDEQDTDRRKDDYNQMVADYGDFERRKQAIIDQFEKKRKVASHGGSDELIKQLSDKINKAFASMSLGDIQGADTFANLFRGIDRLTVDQMAQLRTALETEWAKLDLDPEKLNAIRGQLATLENDANKNLAPALSAAGQAVVENLTSEQKEAIKRLQEEFAKAAGLQDLLVGDGSDYLVARIKAVFPLFTELADATKTELGQIKKVIEGIEVTPDQKALLMTLGLTEKQVDELIAKLEKLKKQGADATDEQKWKSVLEDVGKVSNAVGDLGRVLAGFGGFIGEMGEGLQSLAGSFNDVYTAATSKDKMDIASAGINGLVGLVSLVANQIQENKRAQEAWNAKIVESAHLLKMARLEAMDFKDSNMFGVKNPYAEAISGMEQYAEAMKMLNASAGALEGGKVQTGTKKAVDAGNVLAGVGSGAAVGAAVGSFIPVVGNLVGGLIGALVGGVVGAVSTKTVPVFESLKKKYGEIYNSDTFELNPKILADYDKLDDATKAMVDNWQEIKDKAIEAQKQIEETLQSLAGDMDSTLSEQLKNAFRNGDIYKAVDEYKAYVTATIEDIISQLIFNQVFGQMFDNLSKSMKESFDVGGDQSIIDDIAKFNETYQSGLEAYNQAMIDAQAQMEKDGFGILKKPADKSLKGAIQGASEETTSLLAGYANAIRINQIEGGRLMREQLIALHAIATNTAVLHEILSLMRSGDNTLRSQGL